MNDEQYKRYRKMESDPIKCLFRKHDKNKNLHFLISGSRDTNYKVTIYRDGKIECGCPDFKHNASVQECVCKHCLYVIFHELKCIRDIDHGFFGKRFFTPDELSDIYKIYRSKKLN